MTNKKQTVFDCINDISYNKTNDPELKQYYNSFIVNKAFSLYPDTIMFSNDMNINHHLSQEMQYAFLFNSIRKRKRWAKWPKKINNNTISNIANAYNINYNKANAISKLLTEAQLKQIEQWTNRGGKE